MRCRHVGESFLFVRTMNFVNQVDADEGLHLVNGTGALESANFCNFDLSDEPEQRGHRRAVVQDWCVTQDNGPTTVVTNDDREISLWVSSDEFSDGVDVDCRCGFAATERHGRLT